MRCPLSNTVSCFFPGAARELVTFFCAAKRKLPKKKPPRFTALRVALCCSPRKAAVELADNAQTVLADCPFLGCDSSAALRGLEFKAVS